MMAGCARRRQTHRLAADGAAADDARGGQAHAAGADIAARHEQVIDVAGVIAAVGDGIHALVEVAVGGQLVLVQQAMGRVHIHAPAAVAYRVVKAAMLQDIVFVQQVIALQAAAFAHARQRAHPIQGVVFGVMLVQPLLVVLDMIPDAVGVGHQVVADLLIIGDDIVAVAHQLAPPIAIVDGGAAGHGRALVFLGIGGVAYVDMIAHFHAVDALGQLLFGQVLSEGRGGEGTGWPILMARIRMVLPMRSLLAFSGAWGSWNSLCGSLPARKAAPA